MKKLSAVVVGGIFLCGVTVVGVWNFLTGKKREAKRIEFEKEKKEG